VSEGRGLGEERLRGWHTEEREESSGAGQILMDDGAAVLGRATRTSARGGRARLLWLGCGREENGWKRGMRRRVVLLKSGSVARGREEKAGVGVGTSAWRLEEEERAGPWCSGRQLGVAGNGRRPLGAGGSVAARTGEGGRRG
jgi:hypothetical protein